MSTLTAPDVTAETYTAAERAFIESLDSDYERRYPDMIRGNKTSLIRRYRAFRDRMAAGTWEPSYSYWRHGGSYVDSIVYPSGAVGCIASAAHTASKRFEIACPPDWDNRETFKTRDAAAHAEAKIALEQWAQLLAALEREATR